MELGQSKQEGKFLYTLSLLPFLITVTKCALKINDAKTTVNFGSD